MPPFAFHHDKGTGTLVCTAGMPPVTNTYSSPMTDQAEALAQKWNAAAAGAEQATTLGPADASPADVGGWPAEVLVAFLDRLGALRAGRALDKAVIRHMAECYGLDSSKNAGQQWFEHVLLLFRVCLSVELGVQGSSFAGKHCLRASSIPGPAFSQGRKYAGSLSWQGFRDATAGQCVCSGICGSNSSLQLGRLLCSRAAHQTLHPRETSPSAEPVCCGCRGALLVLQAGYPGRGPSRAAALP